MFKPSIVLLCLTILLLSGCKSTYYNTMEAFGKHKRDLLVDRVEAAQEDQEEAKQQFRTALDRFNDVVRQPESDLKSKYDSLNRELQRSESKAADVRHRIGAIETVAQDLFKEWKSELDQYSNQELRRTSERQLQQTEDRYERLIAAMRRAERSMEPVLTSFRDHVLFLKHNLNAQAVASLQGELKSLEGDTAQLIREMEASIAEAEAFIKQMKSDA